MPCIIYLTNLQFLFLSIVTNCMLFCQVCMLYLQLHKLKLYISLLSVFAYHYIYLSVVFASAFFWSFLMKAGWYA